ncbi:MAG: hypothetical protein U1A77_07530 [Pirellulales bacterium]
MRRCLRSFMACVLLLTAAGTASAADWGDLSLQFVLEGAAPAAKPLTINKDQQVCGKEKLVDETITVGPGGGIASVFVYLRPATGKKVDIHPDLQKLAGTEIVLDNKGCRFEPHAAVLWTAQTLLIKNTDPVGHNTKIDLLENPPVNPIIPAGGMLKQNFKKEERLPASVSCSIHPWMQARLLVRDNPYAAVSGPDGKIVIPKLPVGEWEFQIWHEGAGFIQEAKDSAGKAVKWTKGRAKFTVKKGATDLGAFKVAPKTLSK